MIKTIEEIQKIVKEIFLQVKLDSQPKELYEPIVYTLNLEGKRIRPTLVLMSCNLFNGTIENAFQPAVAIEIFHNFTLLHDDIMDQSPIRRGKETVYKKWNSNIAILSGDTMFAIAYRYLQKTNPAILPQALELFNNTAIEVCEGQQFDMNFENSNNVTIDDYLKMIRLKTAVLLGASLKLGAVIAQASSKDANAIYAFGENIGLAFQLKDDLLDVYANENLFGKQVGTDILDNKKTFLFLKAMEVAEGNNRTKLAAVFLDKTISDEKKIALVKTIYDKLNIAGHTTALMEKYYMKALSKLEEISVPAEKKSELIRFAERLMTREK